MTPCSTHSASRTANKQGITNMNNSMYARWRLSTDASHFAVGGVLEQEQDDGNWHPVAFFSRKLQGSKTAGKHKDKGIGQVGWTVREKETYAVVCSLLKFQSWIGHQEVLVRTDHSSIVQ